MTDDELKDRHQRYRLVFSSDEGKKLLEDLEMMFDKRTIYGLDGPNLNELQLAYKEGQRFVIWWIRSMLNARTEGKQVDAAADNDNRE